MNFNILNNMESIQTQFENKRNHSTMRKAAEGINPIQQRLDIARFNGVQKGNRIVNNFLKISR